MEPKPTLRRGYATENLFELLDFEKKIEQSYSLMQKLNKDKLIVFNLDVLGYDCSRLASQGSRADTTNFIDFLVKQAKKYGFENKDEIIRKINDVDWIKEFIQDLYFAYLDKITENIP